MLFSSKKTVEMLSPCNGRAIVLSDVPDEVFASGMLGQGFAVLPSSGEIFSPISGRIASVAEGKHAYTVTTDAGLDVLVHVGVDTVELAGAPFSPAVKSGDSVRAGELLASADFGVIRDRGLSDAVIVIVTNAERIEAIEYEYGECTGGKTSLMRFRIRRN